MNQKKILFIGCVESSYKLLERLISCKKNIVGVITKSESKFNSDYCDLTELCIRNNIPYCYVNNVNDEESLNFVLSVNPQICYCFGWSQLLKKELINLFPDGVVGFHPAALPNNKGRHPIVWALALGLKETASSFFMINEGADEGDIISQKKIPISYEDDARTLYDKILDVATDQVIEFTEEFEVGTIHKIPQSLNEGNSWRKRTKNDGEIDWRMSSRAIYNLVRSITHPYVGAHLVFQGNEYKVWKVQELKPHGLDNYEPGKVLSVNDDGTIDVKTYDGAIRLLEYDFFNISKGEYII